MSSLYTLNANFIQLQRMMEDDIIDEETFKDTLESIEMEIEDKAEGYAIIMRQLTDEADALKKEMDRLKTRKTTIESNVTRLKESLFASIELTGNTKFKTKLFSFNVRNNAPSTSIPDESLIPRKYKIKQPDKVDKKAVLDALKNGNKVRGAWIKRTRSLTIK